MVVWDYFRNHQDEILSWTWTSVWLAVVPLVIGLVIALPVGWLANRYRWTYPPMTAAAGILYTIPSLVLFLVLPGIIGTKILDPINVAVGLTLYTLALLVRTVADGLNSVSQDTLAAASAMGYTNRQRLFSVQLPIAVPVIGAGLRVAAVSNVALISVASVIGVTQLGQLFVIGFSTNAIPPTLLGLILFILLALILDLLILLVIRLSTPWQRAAVR
jgi:osmoprotectant transport system permease protein